MRRLRAFRDITGERMRQNEKWGPQSHPDGTHKRYRHLADAARELCNMAARRGEVTWRHILSEEFFEATAETDVAQLRNELVQVAAVAVSWIEDIDSRE